MTTGRAEIWTVLIKLAAYTKHTLNRLRKHGLNNPIKYA